MPDDSAVFGDGVFGGPLWGGEGTVTPPSASEVGLYGVVSLEVTPGGRVSGETLVFGTVSLEEIPSGEVTW